MTADEMVAMLEDKRLTFRERVIIGWLATRVRKSSCRQICDGLGLGINATQITLKNLCDRKYLEREKAFDGTFFYWVKQ